MARKNSTTDQPAELGLEGFRPKPEQQGLSLERLSGAFAELLSSGDDPYDAAPVEPPPGAAAEFEPGEDDGSEISPQTIVEAMLFMGNPNNTPLTSRQVSSLMRGVRPAEIDELVRDMNARYAQDGCPYEIIGDGAGYRMVLREEFGRVRDRFHGRTKEATLSQAAIEVLSVVAYHQPVAGDEVGRLRGANSGALLTQLVRRGLLRMERAEAKPHTPQYFTTDRFLRLFGLESLADLPRSEDLERQ